MLAVRTVSAQQLDYVDVPAPQPAEGQALVRVQHATLCGTDLHIFEDDYTSELPLIQGHELSGTVVQAGPEGPQEGERVAIDPLIACGECAACRKGRENVCPHLQVLGCYCDGGFVELLAVDARRLHRLPDSLALELGAVAEPTAISLEAVTRGRAAAGETVLVLGSGPIGLLATLALKDLGATVIAADTVADRLELARDFGAEHILLIDPAVAFPAEELAMMTASTAPDGPELVIEATGLPSSLLNALHAVAPAGRVVQVGISTRPVDFPLNLLPFKEIDLLGSRNSQGLIPGALALIDRHQETVRSLLTHRFGIRDLASAFATLADRDQKVGKILVDVDLDGAPEKGGPEKDPENGAQA